MGGSGSGRKLSKKTTVEECSVLRIRDLAHKFQEIPKDGAAAKEVQLGYNLKRWNGEVEYVAYSIQLTHIPLPWNSRKVKYYFICPLIKRGDPCGRRVSVLYLPPGETYYGCRHCYELTYESCQTSHQEDFIERLVRKYVPDWDAYSWEDPYLEYLTEVQLREQSGLTEGELGKLAGARLLLPDHEGMYRPRLVRWGKKLKALLDAGWEVEEIKRWAGGRFKTPNPKQWPPDRNDWKV